MADSQNPSSVQSTSGVNRVALLGLVILVYTALTAFVFRNFIPHLSSILIGPAEDNMQDFWNTWYAASQVKAFHALGYTNLLKYPEGTTLYYQSFAYPKIFVARIFGAIFGARLSYLTVLQNLLLMMSFPIAAIGGFYLVRHFTKDVVGALVGGGIFAFNPSHIAHVTHHMHVSSIEFIPFFALTFILAVERKSWRFVMLSTLCFALSALSSWYYLFYCAYFMLFLYVFTAIRQKRFFQAWPLRVIVCNIVGLLVLLSPLLVPMIAQAAKGANVYEDGGDAYVADIVAYVAFPQTHILSNLSARIYPHLTGDPWESTVYLGLVNIALLAWLFVQRKRLDRKLIEFVFYGMAVFAVIASGDHFHVFGHSIFGHYVAGHFNLPLRIPLPDLLLDNLPFFKNVRTPSRAIIMLYLFLAIGVGYAVSVLWRERGGTTAGRSAVTALVLFMALDWYAVPLPGMPVVCSPASSILAQDHDRQAAVLDLPRGFIDGHGIFPNRGYVEGNVYMMNQTCHQHPIVDGTVSRIVNQTLEDRLVTADLEQQRRQLTENKVKYIVIHLQGRGMFQWYPEDGQIAQYLKVYPVLFSSQDEIVLAVYQ